MNNITEHKAYCLAITAEQLHMLRAAVEKLADECREPDAPYGAALNHLFWSPILDAIKEASECFIAKIIVYPQPVGENTWTGVGENDTSSTQVVTADPEVDSEVMRSVARITIPPTAQEAPAPQNEAPAPKKEKLFPRVGKCRVCGLTFDYLSNTPYGRFRTVCDSHLDDLKQPIRKIMRHGEAQYKPNPAMREFVALAADGATNAEIMEMLEMKPMELARSMKSQKRYIEELKGLKPGKERFDYLQKHYGLGLPKKDREAMGR